MFHRSPCLIPDLQSIVICEQVAPRLSCRSFLSFFCLFTRHEVHTNKAFVVADRRPIFVPCASLAGPTTGAPNEHSLLDSPLYPTPLIAAVCAKDTLFSHTKSKMPFLLVRNPFAEAKDTLSSWDKCMAKAYCKYAPHREWSLVKELLLTFL
ncbi:hypothetical protein BCR34DRAFT_179135 [Clohesyomyces aquaticus]|uniref:Uncharacterized protein n=1 Tax=Clohesyomyces aquaticus TaxID=1231657 RepID=A0A1Y1YF65_9PLEO|nr:hypothetical protein BCR34DRAFT_179135 [Clohesyomyces aquaticus]